HAVIVTERDEPQAVIGSSLHKLAYPDEYQKHAKREDRLTEAYEHAANGEALAIQVRGEYAYVANGPGGLRVYDIANIDNKGFSERITTAPVSPFGQRFYVKTKYATGVASPSTLAVDPTRKHRPENQEAEYRDDKQPIHPVYAFLYISDKEEGLVVVGDKEKGVSTLLDGNPSNNFLKRQKGFNPDGALNGASNITIAGVYAYITCDRGLAVVNLNNPLEPKLVTILSGFKKPHAVQVQFRYAFVVDEEGFKVVDVTNPETPALIESATLRLADAHNLYLARTYAYVAGGSEGLVIIDIEKPDKPKIDQTYTADGKITDAHDVKVGMTANSLFAYIADGKHGLRVVQLMSPEENPFVYGFSPRATPKLIATFPLKGEALAISKGIDRDRAVDESGNQIAVFNRRGSRPFNLAEMQRMYLQEGKLYTVSNDPPPRPRRPATTAERISSIGSNLYEMVSSLWVRLTAGLLSLGGFALISQRRKQRREESRTENEGCRPGYEISRLPSQTVEMIEYDEKDERDEYYN
ncbi:MAG: LVIVD repeat-containing protein, partial [Blastocatellia bacterium]